MASTHKTSKVQRYWDWFTGSTIILITAGFFCVMVYPRWWILAVLVAYVIVGMAIGIRLNSKEKPQDSKEHWYESTLTEPYHKHKKP